MRILVVTAMYPTPDRPAWGTFVKEQVDSLIEAGIDVNVFSFDGKGSAWNYLKASQALRGILKKKSYDLVHAHYGLTGAAALMQPVRPVVVTFHGSDLLGEVNSHKKYTLAGKIKTGISRGAALCAAERIVVADFLKSKLWPRSAITIPMGVDLSLFKPMPCCEARERLGYAQEKQIVLFAANPNDPLKRFDIARDAVALLQRAGLNVELLPLCNVPHHQVPLYMNACNALVLTSMHEASPCVVKEAMACNLPVVAVNVGDVAERIGDVTGCFMCERTPQDVAAKLRIVLETGYVPDSRSKISALSLQNIARQVAAVYENVLSRR